MGVFTFIVLGKNLRLCKHSAESHEDSHEIPFTEDVSGEIRFPNIPWYQKIFFGICNIAVLTSVL